MRVISGKYKSIKLSSLEGLTTRPTTDKVKENLFNMLYCNDLIVLDLFAGSGSLGIEALSRGAREVTFIDGSSQAIKIIKENVNKCKIKENYYIYRNDFLRALKIFAKQNKKFDLIFLDPPYKKGLIDIALKYFIELNLLNNECQIVCEKSLEEEIKYSNNNLSILKEKIYGSINITIYEFLENKCE